MTREEVTELAISVKNGNKDAFGELEEVARPLLVSLSNRFSRYHYKFDFDDFYSIGLLAIYNACMTYNRENPSFLDYAKVFILREFWHEIKYWNAQCRNVFNTSEATLDCIMELTTSDEVEQLHKELEISDFRNNLINLIDELFDKDKARMIKMYILEERKIIDIASIMDLKYKKVYSAISRGLEKIISEYVMRFGEAGYEKGSSF